MQGLFEKRRSLLSLLGGIIVLVVVAVVGGSAVYEYYSQRYMMIEAMQKSSAHSLLRLEKNITPFMQSYAPSDYAQQVSTEFSLNEYFAIVVRDFNMGKIVGRPAYVSGRILNSAHVAQDFDIDNPEHRDAIKRVFLSDTRTIRADSGELLGEVTVYSSDEALAKELRHILGRTVITAAATAILLITLLLLFTRRLVVTPLKVIEKNLALIDADGLPLNSPPTTAIAEISALTDTIGAMLHAIEKKQNALLESEQRFRLLAEHSPMVILILSGTEQKVEYANPTFTALFGYTFEEGMSAADWWPLAYPDASYRKQVSEEWMRKTEEAIVTHTEIAPMETTVACKDGSKKNVLWGFIATGTQKWAFGFDLTERKQAEDELNRYKTHLEDEVQARTADLDVANRRLSETQFAMDRAGIGIHRIDDEGRFIYVNEYAAQLLGYTQEQMQKMSVPDVDPNFVGKDFKLQTQPLREMGTATFETTERHKNGEIIPLEVTFYYQHTKEGNSGYFIGFVTDIRQRKRIELELRQAKEAAEAANRAKSVFLTSMSHELRTPLNAILGFSSLLRQDEQLRPEQRTNLDIINRSGEHLLTLINDILEMSKIEAGKTQLNITAFDLGALVRDVTDMMELRARTKGLQLLIDQSSVFPRYIMADEARLRQILINLLGNAVKFTQQGGVTLRLGTKQNAIAHLIIEVEDSGPGLSEHDQQHLFQPFMQFGKQAGDNKGTGLGLSITRQFVQLMGGSISATSTLGKGSLFRVDLPLDEVKDLHQLPQPETAKGEVLGLAPNQPIYRILIVEDQSENQLLLTQLMLRIGFEVQVAQDGKQGVQLFQSWHPHLVFMDRRMPNMDGIEATKAIRKLPGGQEVKIVAVTASAFMEQRQEMMAAGMDDFVRKPYRFNEIYESMGRQLGVQYRYADGRNNAEPLPPVALTAAMLAVLPQQVCDALQAALESLDSDCINAALEQVKPIDARLYQTLYSLVDNFDYPAILKLLPTNAQ